MGLLLLKEALGSGGGQPAFFSTQVQPGSAMALTAPWSPPLGLLFYIWFLLSQTPAPQLKGFLREQPWFQSVPTQLPA